MVGMQQHARTVEQEGVDGHPLLHGGRTCLLRRKPLLQLSQHAHLLLAILLNPNRLQQQVDGPDESA